AGTDFAGRDGPLARAVGATLAEAPQTLDLSGLQRGEHLLVAGLDERARGCSHEVSRRYASFALRQAFPRRHGGRSGVESPRYRCTRVGLHQTAQRVGAAIGLPAGHETATANASNCRTRHPARWVKASATAGVHRSRRLPWPSNLRPWSSNPCVSSWPITMPMAP